MGFCLTSFLRLAISLFLLALLGTAGGQSAAAQDNRMIVCLLPLDHADAEQLVAVLSPLLSPNGTITAYSPTNTLIIKDRSSVVQMLVKAVKGKPDLSECDNWKQAPGGN
ncbi:MAG: secretin N-terminal domain-containing protein [Desulfobacterales bacterium]